MNLWAIYNVYVCVCLDVNDLYHMGLEKYEFACL